MALWGLHLFGCDAGFEIDGVLDDGLEKCLRQQAGAGGVRFGSGRSERTLTRACSAAAVILVHDNLIKNMVIIDV